MQLQVASTVSQLTRVLACGCGGAQLALLAKLAHVLYRYTGALAPSPALRFHAERFQSIPKECSKRVQL